MHTRCAPDVFRKLPENQITTNSIYLASSNFGAISQLNYWYQVNSWKNLWKFRNGPLCRNKSGPFSLLNVAGYWKSIVGPIFVKKLNVSAIFTVLESKMALCFKKHGIDLLFILALTKERKTSQVFDISILFFSNKSWQGILYRGS